MTPREAILDLTKFDRIDLPNAAISRRVEQEGWRKVEIAVRSRLSDVADYMTVPEESERET